MPYLIDETWLNLKQGGLVNLLSLLIVVVTILTLSTIFLVGSYIHSEVSQLKEKPVIVAFLKNSINSSEIYKLCKSIEILSPVSSVKYISKKEALSRAKEVFGESGELILEGFKDINPLPASLEIGIKPELLEPEIVERVVTEISSYSQIEDISYEQSSSKFIKNAELLVTGLAVLLGGTSIAVVCFSIMLTSHFRQEEIRIMRLVGATYWYIRLPLIMQGVILGFLGTILGLGLFYWIFHLFTSQIGSLSFLSIEQIITIILIGTGLGLVGGLISGRKYSRI